MEIMAIETGNQRKDAVATYKEIWRVSPDKFCLANEIFSLEKSFSLYKKAAHECQKLPIMDSFGGQHKMLTH
jgi:hypothetical protein